MKSRVYVVQNQHRWDKSQETFVPKFDLNPAREFGELHYLLSPTAAPFRPDSILTELHEKLKDFGPNDFLLLVGNPVLIGFSVAVASFINGGSVSLLQWSGKDQRYVAITAENILPVGFTFPKK